jgi:hypothetical protein
MNDTTRTYPRTMEEAFPKDVESMRRLENSQWFEVHQETYEKWVNIAYAFAAGFIVSMVIFVK